LAAVLQKEPKKMELGNITEDELARYGFSEEEKEIIKNEYRTHKKGFYPNPCCAIR
jgi:hypothetical protein